MPATIRSTVSCQNVATVVKFIAGRSVPAPSCIHSGSVVSRSGDQREIGSDACCTYATRGAVQGPYARPYRSRVSSAGLAANRMCSPSPTTGTTSGELRRQHGARAATVGSSVLFGLWHVLPALGSDAGPGGAGARTAGTVLVTGLAGLGFCWLRVRSGSLLAPALLHWALNGLGLLAVRAA